MIRALRVFRGYITFLAAGHIFIKDFLQRFLALAQPQNIRLNSV